MMRLEFAPSLLQRPVRALRRSYGAVSDEPSVFDECFAAMLTLPILADLLDRYEAMAEAARANDWERLSALEREAAALREAARGDASGAMDDAAALARLPPAEAARLREGIERLLALDVEIRSHTDPFLSSVRKLLSAGRQERALRDAYGASSR